MLFVRMLVVAGMCCATAAAQTDGPKTNPTKEELAKLQGYWKLKKYEKNFRSDFFPSGHEGMYIENQRITWVRKGDILQNNSEGRLLIDPAKTPKVFEIADEHGGATSMIYKIDGDRLYLAVRLEEKRLPTEFSVQLAAGAGRATHLVIFKRVADEKAPENAKEPDPKADRAELDKAVLKDLQGFWILDKATENGSKDFGCRFTDAIYIEGKTVKWVQKNGYIGWPHWNAMLSVNGTEPARS